MKSILSDRPRGWWSEPDVAAALKRIKDLLESGLDEQSTGGIVTLATQAFGVEKFERRFGVCPAGFCAETVATTAQLYASVAAPANGWVSAVSAWMTTVAPGGTLRMYNQGAGSPTTIMPGTAASGADVVTALPRAPIGTTDELAVEAVLAATSFAVFGGVIWQKYEHVSDF